MLYGHLWMLKCSPKKAILIALLRNKTNSGSFLGIVPQIYIQVVFRYTQNRQFGSIFKAQHLERHATQSAIMASARSKLHKS